MPKYDVDLKSLIGQHVEIIDMDHFYYRKTGIITCVSAGRVYVEFDIPTKYGNGIHISNLDVLQFTRSKKSCAAKSTVMGFYPSTERAQREKQYAYIEHLHAEMDVYSLESLKSLNEKISLYDSNFVTAKF